MRRFIGLLFFVLIMISSCLPKKEIKQISLPTDTKVSLVEPKEKKGLPVLVKTKYDVQPNDVMSKLQNEDIYLYIFQHNMKEDSQKWHYVGKIIAPEQTIEINLGNESVGKNETYQVKIIISSEKKNYRTGSNNVDVVMDKDLPAKLYQTSFILERGN